MKAKKKKEKLPTRGGYSLAKLATKFDNGVQRQRESNDLQVALDAILKLPPSENYLEISRGRTDREHVAFAALESVERLCLSGLSGLHSVRYLRSLLLATREGTYPHQLDPYSSPLLEALEINDGYPKRIHSGNRGGGIPVNRTKIGKKTARK